MVAVSVTPAQPRQPETLGELPGGTSAPTARRGMEAGTSTTADQEKLSPAGRKRPKAQCQGLS